MSEVPSLWSQPTTLEQVERFTRQLDRAMNGDAATTNPKPLSFLVAQAEAIAKHRGCGIRESYPKDLFNPSVRERMQYRRRRA